MSATTVLNAIDFQSENDFCSCDDSFHNGRTYCNCLTIRNRCFMVKSTKFKQISIPSSCRFAASIEK